MSVRYKTIGQFSIESGYTEAAINTKIRDGVWAEGLVWVKAPDGRRLISVEGYNQWVDSTMAFAPRLHRRSKSTSTMRVGGAGKELGLSPPPLI